MTPHTLYTCAQPTTAYLLMRHLLRQEIADSENRNTRRHSEKGVALMGRRVVASGNRGEVFLRVTNRVQVQSSFSICYTTVTA